jgi:ribosomal protein S18 acetylase RimI-like enzyme
VTAVARTVRPAKRADVRGLAATMARAFDDDPLMMWIFPDAAVRGRRLPRLFAVLLRRYYLASRATELVADGEQILGGAMWAPPGQWPPPVLRQLAAVPSLARALGGRLLMASETSSVIARSHPGGPHWYLSGIGTEPAMQRTGVGGLLLASRLDRCDAAGMPVYLESSKLSNVGYYERFGFTVAGEIQVPGGGPMLWPMTRPPRRGG